jgi:hypothetical protein
MNSKNKGSKYFITGFKRDEISKGRNNGNLHALVASAENTTI